MQRQLADIVKGLERAQARLDKLAESIPEGAWQERTEPNRWSVAECITHLNLTSEAYIPRIQAALAKAKAMNSATVTHYKRDLLGALFGKVVGPLLTIGRMRIGRVKTMPAFVPGSSNPKQETLARFKRDQDNLVSLIREGDGLPLDKVMILSPFGDKISYNLYSALVILERHEQRHLDQAQLVWSTGKHDLPA